MPNFGPKCSKVPKMPHFSFQNAKNAKFFYKLPKKFVFPKLCFPELPKCQKGKRAKGQRTGANGKTLAGEHSEKPWKRIREPSGSIQPGLGVSPGPLRPGFKNWVLNPSWGLRPTLRYRALFLHFPTFFGGITHVLMVLEVLHKFGVAEIEPGNFGEVIHMTGGRSFDGFIFKIYKEKLTSRQTLCRNQHDFLRNATGHRCHDLGNDQQQHQPVVASHMPPP